MLLKKIMLLPVMADTKLLYLSPLQHREQSRTRHEHLIAAMLKRTKGYVLLTLLVVTGLASRVSHTTLTGKERKFLLQQLKTSRYELQESLKGLTAAQLNFKPSPHDWSVQQHVQHLALTEETVWALTEEALKKVPDAKEGYTLHTTDAEIQDTIEHCTPNNPLIVDKQKGRWKTSDDAWMAFKEERKEIITYVKTTTEDVRRYSVRAPFGSVDAYRVLSMLSAHTNLHVQQIKNLKALRSFTKR